MKHGLPAILILLGMIAGSAYAGMEALNEANGTPWAKLGSAQETFKDARLLTNDQGIATYSLNRPGLLFNGLAASAIELGFESNKLISIEFIVSDCTKAEQECARLYGTPKVLEAPMSGKMWEGKKVVMTIQRQDNSTCSISLMSAEYCLRTISAAFEEAFK